MFYVLWCHCIGLSIIIIVQFFPLSSNVYHRWICFFLCLSTDVLDWKIQSIMFIGNIQRYIFCLFTNNPNETFPRFAFAFSVFSILMCPSALILNVEAMLLQLINRIVFQSKIHSHKEHIEKWEKTKNTNKNNDVYSCICYLHTWNMENCKSDRVSSICSFFWNVVKKISIFMFYVRHSTFTCDYRLPSIICYNDENKWELFTTVYSSTIDHRYRYFRYFVFRQPFQNEMKWNCRIDYFMIMNEVYFSRAHFLYLNLEYF